jgi:hypothetical protein
LNRPLERVSVAERQHKERHEVSARFITHFDSRRRGGTADRAGSGDADTRRA